MVKNQHGNRIYDKGHVCYYCNTQCLKISRHLLTVHKSETEVMKVLAIDTSTNDNRKRRAKELDRLRYRGDFYHNLKVLKTGGELKVFRRPGPGENVDASMFTPCTHCLAFIRKHDLWRHVKQCTFNEERTDGDDKEKRWHRKLQYESELLLFSNRFPEGSSEALGSQVLSTMRSDEITQTVKSDKLILMVGSSLLERGGSTKISYISQRMRTLARLLLKVQENEDSNSTVQFLMDCIAPSMFDIVIKATKSLCGYSQCTTEAGTFFSKPGLALNVGYDLRKAALLLRGQAIRLQDKDLLESVNGFTQLYELEWKIFISSAAGRSLDENKFQSPGALPITSDLIKIRDFCSTEIPATIARLEAQPCLQDWRFLAELTASRLIIFNKRRGNEGTKITIEEFEKRPEWKKIQVEDVAKSLQPLEKELCKR